MTRLAPNGLGSGNWTIAFIPSENTCGFGPCPKRSPNSVDSTPWVPSARIVMGARISSAGRWLPLGEPSWASPTSASRTPRTAPSSTISERALYPW